MPGLADSPHSEPNRPLRLLVVEDNPADASLVRIALREALPGGVEVTQSGRLSDARTLLADREFDAVLLDLTLPDSTGPETLRHLRETDADVPILVLTGHSDHELGCRLLREGAQDFLVKGEFNPAPLARAVQHAVERKKLEHALEEARAAAQSASEAKSSFVASVSHDIRSPLASILGMIDLLLSSSLDPDQSEYVQVLERSARSLLSLVNNVLELSSVESGNFTLESEPYELEAILAEAAELFAFSAHKKGLTLVLEVDPALPRRLVGDGPRLRQVVANLVGNAVKFTERGRVVARASRVDGDALLLEVEDTGPGIADSDLARIFERFERGQDASTQGGVGLGLAICREIVSRMEGRIRAERREEGGARFTVRVPLRPAPAEPRPTGLQAGLRCLLALADAEERESVEKRLEAEGLAVTAVADGAGGRAAVEEAARAVRPFQCIVVDCRLPDGGGLGILRLAGPPGEALRTVALLTLDHRPGDPGECEELGARTLVKPLRPQHLLDVLAGRDPGRPPAIEGTPRLDGISLLVVDDSSDVLALLRAWLRGAGCAVSSAEDGLVALERLERGRFDLVLMDIDMPRLGGLEATARWRAREARDGIPRVPIVALTAHAFREQGRRCVEAGCDAHLTKPVERANLLEAVARHARPCPPEEKAAATGAASEDADVLASLLPGYLENRRADVAALRDALGREDLDRTRRLGHRMKGSGAAYGVAEVSRIGADLEKASCDGDTRGVARAIDELARLLDRRGPPSAPAAALRTGP